MKITRPVRPDATDQFQRTWRGRTGIPITETNPKPVKAGKLAPPVWPNRGVEAWYRSELQNLIREMSQSVLSHVRGVWNKNSSTIGFAQDAPNSSVLLRRAMEKWGKLWTNKLNTLSDSLAAEFAKKARTATDTSVKASFESVGFTVKFAPTQGMTDAYQAVVGENVNLIKSIPQKYMTDVQSAVWQNVMKGGDLATLSKTIQEKYGIAYRRAALIARDQNNKAKAVYENVRRQELGIEEATWMHSSAGKEPRPTHVAMNEKRYKLGQGMWDSGEGEYVWPGQLINCRCTSRAVIPGFD